jgi:putative peptide zinc metalloprotease protein
VDGDFVLRSTATSAVLRLGRAETELWEAIDGERSVEDLATRWFLAHGSCSIDRLAGFLSVLRRHGFIEVRRGSFLFARREAPAWYDREWRWTGVGRWACTGARFLGPLLRREFVPVAMALVVAAVVVAGLGPAWPRLSWPWVAAMMVALVGNVLVHEAGHAIMTAHFGRRVRALGLSWRGAFVDTTEMFTARRAQHAAVAAAGPISNLLVASVCALVRAGGAGEWWLGIAAEAGVLVALLTGLPVVPRSDGARALAGVQASGAGVAARVSRVLRALGHRRALTAPPPR